MIGAYNNRGAFGALAASERVLHLRMVIVYATAGWDSVMQAIAGFLQEP